MSQENERWENCPEISCHSNDRKRVFGHCVNPQTTHPWHSVPPKPAPSAAVTADKGLERLIKFLNICDECDEPATNCFCDAALRPRAGEGAEMNFEMTPIVLALCAIIGIGFIVVALIHC